MICNRCKHHAPESKFKGMQVNLYDFGGLGKGADEWNLCDQCIESLRRWLDGEGLDVKAHERTGIARSSRGRID
jgi:hypothetical protein